MRHEVGRRTSGLQSDLGLRKALVVLTTSCTNHGLHYISCGHRLEDNVTVSHRNWLACACCLRCPPLDTVATECFSCDVNARFVSPAVFGCQKLSSLKTDPLTAVLRHEAEQPSQRHGPINWRANDPRDRFGLGLGLRLRLGGFIFLTACHGISAAITTHNRHTSTQAPEHRQCRPSLHDTICQLSLVGHRFSSTCQPFMLPFVH